jgi:hypothetical protein
MHLDDAFDFLIERLTALPDWTGPMAGNARNATYGCDLWIPQIVAAYWQPRITGFTIGDLSDEHFRLFYDAAWEMIQPDFSTAIRCARLSSGMCAPFPRRMIGRCGTPTEPAPDALGMSASLRSRPNLRTAAKRDAFAALLASRPVSIF